MNARNVPVTTCEYRATGTTKDVKGNKYSENFIVFAKYRMALQGEDIRRWSQSDNPILQQFCEEIIEAAEGT